MRRGLLSLAWGSAQASASLTLASAAWLVSGLTASPLINSLLPVLATAAALMPLPQQPLLGSLLQLLATLLLLAIGLHGQNLDPATATASATGAASAAVGGGVVLPLALALLAVLLFGLGLQIGQLPLQRFLVGVQGISMRRLRSGSELGALLGHLLTALLFPIGKAVLQFSQALVLLLPLLPAALLSRRPGRRHLPPRSGPDLASAGSSTALTASAVAASTAVEAAAGANPGGGVSLNWRCCLQGILFGSLFGLLPLWVRQLGGGSCFDFGMVLTAYGLGRLLAAAGPAGSLPSPPALVAAAALAGPWRLHPARGLPYLLLAFTLAATQWLPGWGSLVLFLPMGGLAALSDARLVATLDTHPDDSATDEPLRWQILARSSGVGALAGSLLMGGTAQLLGLPLALPLQVLAFAAAAVPLSLAGRRRGLA
ncbi:hypothetical protein KBY86_06130 [Synechococcus sp. Lug-A]|jgi:hypothetical protein|uniref:hypothetical protein n=1 Tax=Synechococcus sp. Lug-A TaxID=2823740 RepID=UPI0020CD43E1|nr:hypothetical protein [Synechococcus sp. Lug-A]MCP9846465.1 hypothetical protein [Synechococcus sp. Lug-A]